MFGLVGSIESTWASNSNDKYNTIGHRVYFGDSLVSWSSSKQKEITRSSIEADCKALVLVASNIDKLKSLLKEL